VPFLLECSDEIVLMDTLNAADLLPEFELLPSLVNGSRYVIAKRPHEPEGHLHVTTIYPEYVADTDSWRFPSGDCRRRSDQDLWIPFDEFPAAEGRARERYRLRTSGVFSA
jgi:hypothetical protein